MLLRNPDQPEYDAFSFIGNPGAGKGTVVSAILKDQERSENKPLYFEVGQMVRQNVSEGTEFGKQAVEASDSGRLVAHRLIIPKIREGILNLFGDAEEGTDERKLFLDGYPRHILQVPSYEELMDELGRTQAIIHLDLDPEAAEERMRKRGEAAGAGARKDDLSEEKRRQRLDEAKALEDVLGYFAEKGRVLRFDAAQSPEAVYRAVRIAIFGKGSKIAPDHNRVAAPAY